ncbi:hypothetical protein ABT399_00005, partial [Streptomyces halstedii]
LLAPQLVARLNTDLGHGTVRMIKVMGPGPRGRRATADEARARPGPGPLTRARRGPRSPARHTR